MPYNKAVKYINVICPIKMERFQADQMKLTAFSAFSKGKIQA